MVHRLPSQGAYERLEPYAGKLARTVLRGEWRSNALFLPDKPANGNGNANTAPAQAPAAAPAQAPAATTADPDDGSDIPF